MLTLTKREPFWLTLIPAAGKDPAVRARFAPITRAMKRKAARASRAVWGDGPVPADELSDAELDALYDAGEAASRALIRFGLLDQPEPAWEGIGDAAGKPLPVTEETVEMALDEDRFFEAADRLYVQPAAFRDAEKNGSPASPNGTGEAGTRARATASSAAARRKKAAAKPVRTPSTRSKAPRRKPPGKS